jgi:chromosome segregation protein
MYLSKIEILGFKSFANKTTLLLNDGITAIVGPNGCGKTNIVDALRWSLGEQRYSTLRSDKMEDVIFNGTKHRKPIGMAEVSLTIQNNKGVLPLEYNEVTITRRVFRSGESDYLLNRTSCRLKDIISLFMDTGMGSNAYSVIELKMIETILSDKTEERRRLFEEAAGITKYKSRRKETFRRLEEVQSDLIRVDDIISEITKAVNSLHRQARKAERYNEFQERLHTLELDVLRRDFTGLHQRLEPLQLKLDSERSERDSVQVRMDQAEALLHVYRTEEREIEDGLENARNEHDTMRNEITGLEQDYLVCIEKRKAHEQDLERLSESIRNSGVQISELTERRIRAEAQLVEKKAELESLESVVTQRQAEHQANDESFTRMKLENSARQDEKMELVQSLSRLESEIHAIENRRQSIHQRIDSLRTEREKLKPQIEALQQQFEESHGGEEHLGASVIAAERNFHEMEEKKTVLKNEVDRLQNLAFELQGRIGERMTRIDFLNGLVDRLEGFSESVQHLLRNRDWTTSKLTTVADAVNTRDDLRVAVEAALGDAPHYIVVNDLSEAISGLQNLKDNNKGKATFVCLSHVPKCEPVPFPLKGEGAIGWAMDLVHCHEKHEDLFRYLLRNTLIVRDAETANRCIKDYPDVRCITLAGDVFDSSGFVRGGSTRQDEGSLIGKREQIAALEKEVEKLKKQLADNQLLLEDRNSEYQSIDLRRHAEEIKNSQMQLSVHEQQVARLRFEMEKNERALQNITAEQDRLNTELSEMEARSSELGPELDRLSSEKTVLDETERVENSSMANLERKYNQSMQDLHASNLVVVEKRAEIERLQGERDRSERGLRDLEERIKEAEASMELARTGREELSLRIESLAAQTESLKTEYRDHVGRIEEIERNLVAKRSEVDALEQTLQKERNKHSQSVALVHDIELKETEIKQRIENLEIRAKDEFEVTLEILALDSDDVFDLAQAKEEINDLKLKLKSLGLVNPLAFEEWQQEKERQDLLTAQRADLLAAEKTLKDTIEEINVTAQQKFRETFEEVRTNFITIFKTLFEPGDEADLIIEDNVDPLEARIDIIAKPRGKRPHTIEMLSGGEKTLTAIALLFAIYLVKPSPFCILDEVDAPLDDANIDRFIRIIQKFSRNTQFIIVTHNKRTMEAADTLFGVTMEEEGVSKLVAVKFDDETIAKFSQN